MLSKSKKSTYKMSGKELEQVGEIQAKVIRFPKLSEERRVQSGTEGANGPLRCRRGLTPGGPPDARATDVNVVGAPRREARPRPPGGSTFSGFNTREKNKMTDLLKTKNRTSQFYELHGMTLEQWRILYHIFDRFRDTLSWVKLFGSRARGDYKTTSDVDLAIASKTDILTPLQTALEDSQLPYTFDLEDGIERSQTGSSGPIRCQTSAGWR